ncbi:hypothetical protein N2152v2_002154 [Parachlorella kessleri]
MRKDIGDNILVQGQEARPYVAKILGITSNGQGGGYRLKVVWYYYPDDQAIPGGRKSFHGRQELYSSDHLDTVHSGTILDRCNVLPIDEYSALEEVLTKEFLPPSVYIYCLCRLPENPDRVMIQCDGCTEWYHPECCGLSADVAASLQQFFCPKCQQACAASTPAVQAPGMSYPSPNPQPSTPHPTAVQGQGWDPL